MRVLVSVGVLVALGGGLVGCGGADYEPKVICHNANCKEPTNPGEDSMMASMEASLLLEDEAGRPLIDGMEIDTFWSGEAGECLFAHDLDHPERAVNAMVPVERIVEVLEGRQAAGRPLARAHDEFTVKIELKGHVGPSKAEAHSEAQRAAHAGCAVAMGERFVESANLNGYEVEIVFMSFAPALLEALVEDPGYAGLRGGGHSVRLAALQGIPRPLDSQTVELDRFRDDIGIDMISAHSHWARRPMYEAAQSRGMEVGFWMFNIVPETLRAIEVYQPGYVTTSQAPSFVAWLER